MSAEVENMFYVRETPWHGLGTMVQEALSSEEALKTAGLDWMVNQSPAAVKLPDGSYKDTEFIFNCRNSDNSVLGIVSKMYKVVQNVEAFAFTDSLISTGEVKYETAGSLYGGKKVWLLAKMPEHSILGDVHVPYILFANSHDGSSAVRVTMTNTRVVCQNTLNIALAGANRIWSCPHVGNMQERLTEAQKTLSRANAYMSEFKKESERLAAKKFSPSDVRDILDVLFPVSDDSIGIRKLNNMIYLRSNFEAAINRPDIEHLKNTAFGLVNAASDFISHTKPIMKTRVFEQKRLESFMEGNKFLDQVYKLVA